MKSLLLFRDVGVGHAKVNFGPFVGLPSMTGVHGLGGALCLALCEELGLSPADIRLDASLFAYDEYTLHEGFKKGFKPGTATSEALPAAWASFNAHLLYRIEACTPQAASALARPDFRRLAAEVLSSLRLCKGTLSPQRQAVNLDAPVLRHLGSDLQRALAMLPPRARVVRDRSGLIETAREAGLPLIELLLAATSAPAQRPKAYRDFFAEVEEQVAPRRLSLVPVYNGHFFLEDSPSGQAQRLDAMGHVLPAWASSASYTLAEIQSVASVRAHFDETAEDYDPDVFWRSVTLPQGVFLHASA
jgi:hypothetical protein